MARTKEATIKQMKAKVKEVYGKEIRIDLDNISPRGLTELYELADSIAQHTKSLEMCIFEYEQGIR